MTDADIDVVVDVDQLRRSMKRTHTRLRRHHERFNKMHQEDSPATTDFHQLEEAYKAVEVLSKEYKKKSDQLDKEEEDEAKFTQDEADYEEFQELLIATRFVIKLLLSKRAVHRAMISLETAVDVTNKAFMAEPGGDHAPAVTVIKDKAAKLSSELEKTNVLNTDALIIQAKEVQEKAGLIQAKVTKMSKPAIKSEDDKPSTKDGSKSGFKVAHITVPTFSGALEDWQAFWSAFDRAMHQSEDFSKAAKLHHLREAMKDKALYRRLSPVDQPDDYYDEAVAKLKKSFDQPKKMHLKYIKDVVNMGPVQANKAALNKCADVLRDSLKGAGKL